MKRIICYTLLLTLLFSSSVVLANDAEGSGHDVGFSFGPNFALTDLGGAKKIGSPFLRDIDFQATRYCISAFYRYNVNKIFAVRANLMYGMLKADDKNKDGQPPVIENGVKIVQEDDSWYRARRNLNFTTHIFEFQGMAEINLKKYMHDEGKGSKERWAPYIGGGLGFFWFNPYTTIDGNKVKLKPEGTEGQYILNPENVEQKYPKAYSNVQFDLIGLIGIKYNVTEKFSIAIEGVYHQTFTDYLDDVSGAYINPADIASLSATGQILQNRSNTGNYPSNEFNFVENQYQVNNTVPPARDLKTTPGAIGYQRGDKKDNDQFMHVQLTFSFTVGNAGSKFGGAFGKHYKNQFSCPKW